MKRVLTFLLLAAVGIGVLLWKAGDWNGISPEESDSGSTTERARAPRTAVTGDSGVPVPDAGVTFGKGRQLELASDAEFFTWSDPEAPDDIVEIPNFIRYEFKTADFEPLSRDDADRLGVLCHDVVLKTYRNPRTRAEALAVKQGRPGARKRLLSRVFTASEARAYGRLAERIGGADDEMDLSNDSKIHLTGNVEVEDLDEDVVITGSDLTVMPKIESASGEGRFELVHDGFTITGDGLELDKLAGDRTRIKIKQSPIFDLKRDVRDKQDRSVLGFEEGAFRPSSIRAEGHAIVMRDDFGNQSQLEIEFQRHVRAEQEGGRSLHAHRMVMVARKPREERAKEKGWHVDEVRATAIKNGKVRLEYADQSNKGTSLLSVSASRLKHVMPKNGRSTTLLEGGTVFVFREVPPGGVDDRSNGMVHVSCRRRAWIGPYREGPVPEGLKRDELQRISLVGDARIERHGSVRRSFQDVISGDEIEFIFMSASDPFTSRPTRANRTDGEEPGGLIAVAFTALGNVNVSGTRVNGTTERLVARALHTERPWVIASGQATRFRFTDIRNDQRLLGGQPAVQADGATAPAASTKGEWKLRYLRARQDVIVQTSLGGPSFGIPARVTGEALDYDDQTGLAQVTGTPVAPAFLSAEAANGKPNTIHAHTLSLRRGTGQVTANGNVRSVIFVTSKRGQGPSGMRAAMRSAPPKEAAALEIETDHEIDIRMVRTPTAMRAQEDAEQIITINGPLTAELRANDLTVDRMRARSMKLSMVLASPEAAQAAPTTARAGFGHTVRGNEPTRTIPAAEMTEVEIDAAEITANVLTDGKRVFEAFGGVELRTEMGRVLGQRMVFDESAREVRVTGSDQHKAEAWYGTSEARNHVVSEQFVLLLGDHGGERLVARGKADDPVVARLYRKNPETPGRTEHYFVTCWAKITILPERLDAEDVRVIRTITGQGADTQARLRLYAKRLRVTGRHFLSAEETDVRRVVASGKDTYFGSGSGIKDDTRVWGSRFDLDVPRQEATITGTPDEDVVFQHKDEVHSEQSTVTIDLATGLPKNWRAGRVIRKKPK